MDMNSLELASRYPIHTHIIFDAVAAALSSPSGKQRAWGRREQRRRRKNPVRYGGVHWDIPSDPKGISDGLGWGFAQHSCKAVEKDAANSKEQSK